MPPGRPIALRSPSPFESDGCDRGSEDFPAAPTDGTLSCFRRDAWEPVIGLVPSRGSGSSLVGGLPGVRTASAQDYFKRRARNWRACRLRVNALASRLGRSRFARRVRAFATRGCVRGGLLGWASGEVRPSVWPTVPGVPANCLSEHRETSRPDLSLVHSSRGRNA